VVKEGHAVSRYDNEDVEARALAAKRKAFKSCMLKYAV